MNVSFASEELMEEVKQDIAEFGPDEKVMVWIRWYPAYDARFIVNYDFIVDDDPIDGDELAENETLDIMALSDLLEALQEQNRII